jgi:hypothetical protein
MDAVRELASSSGHLAASKQAQDCGSLNIGDFEGDASCASLHSEEIANGTVGSCMKGLHYSVHERKLICLSMPKERGMAVAFCESSTCARDTRFRFTATLFFSPVAIRGVMTLVANI